MCLLTFIRINFGHKPLLGGKDQNDPFWHDKRKCLFPQPKLLPKVLGKDMYQMSNTMTIIRHCDLNLRKGKQNLYQFRKSQDGKSMKTKCIEFKGS